MGDPKTTKTGKNETGPRGRPDDRGDEKRPNETPREFEIKSPTPQRFIQADGDQGNQRSTTKTTTSDGRERHPSTLSGADDGSRPGESVVGTPE